MRFSRVNAVTSKVYTLFSCCIFNEKKYRKGSREKSIKLRCVRKIVMRGGQKKHNRKYFGYNNHVNTDVKSKVILKATVTAAHVHDSQEVKPPGIPHYKIFLAVAFFYAKFHRGTSKKLQFLKGSHQFFLGGRGKKRPDAFTMGCPRR